MYVGSGDVVGGNLKLILGLIWTLILHYQISMGLSKTPSSTKNSESTTSMEEPGMLKDKLLSFLKVELIHAIKLWQPVPSACIQY